MHTLGSSGLFLSFLTLTLALVALVLMKLSRLAADGRLPRHTLPVALGAAGSWLLLSGGLAISGALNVWEVMPPPPLLVMPALLSMTFVVAFSRFGLRLTQCLSLRELVGIQAFRLPLELMMYTAMLEGVMPAQMSFAGYNWDIITGASAVLIVVMSWRRPLPEWVAWSFNLMGTLLLAIVLSIAVASLPVFAAFGPERLNTWVFYFPYFYLPALMVPLGLLSHLLSFRKLLGLRRERARAGSVEGWSPLGSHR